MSEEEEDLSDLAEKFLPASQNMTAYTLYMREHYNTFKTHSSQEDPKVLFDKCNDLWEKESKETKELYEVKCKSEIEKSISECVSRDLEESSASMDSNVETGGESLSFESAARLASLIAARHIDVSTRDDVRLELHSLLEGAMIHPDGLGEI